MVHAKLALDSLIHTLRIRIADDEGAIPVEYLGILIFAAAVVLAIVGLQLDTEISNAVRDRVRDVITAS
jgi:Flp pilus assembly pilin Flp